MISINNIYKYFGDLKVLNGVACNIQKGEKVAFDMQYPHNDQCTEAELLKKIRQVKYQMDIEYITKNEIYNEDISTGYFSSLQKKLFNSFNRHKTAFPDKELTKTFAYVFFTML